MLDIRVGGLNEEVARHRMSLTGLSRQPKAE
jgi:hypothetical protein